MACNAVTTGQGFLTETLAHLDCQAQSIGGLGYGALADSGSPAGAVLVALLTLFIAIFGLRLLFAGEVGARDAVGAMLKIGIVLTLAASWPAYRTLAYDTVLRGPAEIAAALDNENLPEMQGGLAARLQGIDDGIVALTSTGTGRQVGSLDVPGEQRGSFSGIALQDESGFAWGRTVFLGATIGPLAALRVTGGLLLAVAPLVAGLLLFEFSRGIFAGWARGLFLIALGSLGITLLLAVQIAIMEPWLVDTLQRRNLGYATPGAANELLAITLGFAIAAFGLLAILARVSFQNGWFATGWGRSRDVAPPEREAERSFSQTSQSDHTRVHSRALAVSDGMLATMRRENATAPAGDRRVSETVMRTGPAPGPGRSEGPSRSNALGSNYRRNDRRRGGSHGQRDTRR